jgi:antirestriction protein ArdC
MKAAVNADAVKRAVDALVAEVEAGYSARLKDYLAAMARFHRYSLGNVLLIGMQRPQATHVAGFRAWQRMGRRVRKGERGIRIMAPIIRRATTAEDEQERVVAFRSVSVFDVSQTDGKPLPGLGRVSGDPGEFVGRLRALVAEHGIALEYADLSISVDGWSAGGRIGIRTGLSPAEEFSVLVHEFAHELLHRTAKRWLVNRTVRETEAEAVAFVVCKAIGLETNQAAADYIQLYDGDRDTLLNSLDRIQQTARVMIDGLLGTTRKGPGTGEPLTLLAKRPAA